MKSIDYINRLIKNNNKNKAINLVFLLIKGLFVNAFGLYNNINAFAFKTDRFPP